MIYWAPLLHLYQPQTQTYQILEKVCHESYRPLVKLLTDFPHARATININATLTEMLAEHGMSDVLDGLRELAEKGQIEFTGSAKYHPILPLIPQDEALRQVILNQQTNRHYLGERYVTRGFFPPEMCYSPDLVPSIIETGHKWLILAGIACPVAWPTTLIHEIRHGRKKLPVFFRDCILSNKIAFRGIDAPGFLASLRAMAGNSKDIYVITAMDGETFGHHIKDWDRLFLGEVYKALEQETQELPAMKVDDPHEINSFLETATKPDITAVTISDLLELFPPGEAIKPHPSSWSTTADDIQAGNPYPLWYTKDNHIHQLQWQHLKLATWLTHQAISATTTKPVKNFADLARNLLDQAMQSDQFWWASRKPWWDINMINQGLMKQSEVILNAYQAVRMSRLSDDVKTECYHQVLAAGELRNRIIDRLFVD
ncbi:MAG: hypothetical protein ABIB93_05610 [Chloroflexota bacterium]